MSINTDLLSIDDDELKNIFLSHDDDNDNLYQTVVVPPQEDIDESDEFAQEVPDLELPLEETPTGAGGQMENISTYSGEEYMLAKIGLCNKFYGDEKCSSLCPLFYITDQGESCLHADIKDSASYQTCQAAIMEFRHGATNMSKLFEVFPDFKNEYLSEHASQWLTEKYGGGKDV